MYLMEISQSRRRPSTHNRPDWANAISARREALGKRQEDVSEATNEMISQSTMSDLERGKVQPFKMETNRVFALLHFLEWTIEEFIENTGLELPFITKKKAEAIKAMQYLEVKQEGVNFKVYASVSAGSSDPEPIKGESVTIPTNKLKAVGANANFVRCYRVNGDCLVSIEATKVNKNIADGDVVAIDMQRKPQVGDLVVAWWEEKKKMVVKRYKIEREGIILYPARPGHPTVVLPHEDMAQILGVVIWRGG
jgi:SOS-response transcriptional repressor LexA